MMMTRENRGQFRNSFLLFLTAVIWGCGFVAQSVGMEYIGPFTFTALRNIIGALFLLPVLFFRNKFFRRDSVTRKTAVDATEDTFYVERKEGRTQKDIREKKRATVTGGICCGIFLCIASNFQQFGLMYTTVGKAGFITALYVVFVPVIGLFFRKKVTWFVWLSVIFSVAGLYLLCMTGSHFSLQFGDFLELICAVMFSLHIMVIDYFTTRADSVAMSAIQFLVCGLLSLFLMLITEHPHLTYILAAWKPILYAGIFASGMGYTLQMVGQKGVNSTVASLIMCMESVVSAVAGWLFLGQALSVREIIGCVLMFTAIVLAQLKGPEKNI